MQSNQYFIIWNHGFKYLEEIISIIRDHPSLNITKILRKTINIKNFINHIYKLDKSSYQHIEEKSKYLYSLKPEIFIIFVKDVDTIYKYKPNSSHKYSYHETFIKWKIRLLYNPRTIGSENKEIIISDKLINDVSIQRSWINFITHNHVIHSSDIEEETNLILNFYNLNPREIFDLTGNIYFNHKKEVKEINISEIVVNTVYKDHMNIKDTPHYKYLLGKKELYDNYILKSLGTIIQHDNLSGAYDILIKNFEYGKVIQNIPNYIICEYNKKINKYVVFDGVHRLAILVHNNIDKIKVYSLIK